MYVVLNGKLKAQKKAMISVTDNGFLYGDAVYETIRTKDGDLWMLGKHLRRLKKSAKAVGMKIPYTKKEIRRMIEELIIKNKLKEARIRITLSRGANGLDFGFAKKPTFLVQAETIVTPPKDYYEQGVSIVTYAIERPMPKVKSTSMLPTIVAYRHALKKNAFEAVFVDHRGRVLECSMSNIFFVRNGKIITPKKNVLEGTVRNLVIKKARVKQTTIKKRDLPKMEECFITSTIKGVLPVTKINGKKVGNGNVGPITKNLMKIL
jgi:branched-chain amino acid aminotransferase